MSEAVASVLSLKDQKEAFVTGHNGTTPWEILLVCLPATISVACYQSLTTTTNSLSWRNVGLEAAIVWFPMIICQTNYLYPYGICILLLQGLWILIQVSSKTSIDTQRDEKSDEVTHRPRLVYLTAYRSSVLYLTFIAILAVDFHVFPRRFAKTEVAGYGLMDVGAASFCFSAGLVSRRARKSSSTTNKSSTASTLLHSLRHFFLHTAPLVVIGIIRIVTNQELEYQEHVSEYGIHWNFFFTMAVLAIVPPFVGLVLRIPTWIVPTILMMGYQVALSVFGLQEYIEDAPRQCHENMLALFPSPRLCYFVAANREGILGCIGYLSLFWGGEWIGWNFVWNPNRTTSEKRLGLANISIFLWSLLGLLTRSDLALAVSRRSTNAPFCIWAAAHNTLLLTALQYTVTSHVPPIWETVNRHGLILFLIANLLTGLVNLTIPTLEVEDPWALAIVFGYICVVGMAALLWDKLWTKATPIGKKKD